MVVFLPFRLDFSRASVSCPDRPRPRSAENRSGRRPRESLALANRGSGGFLDIFLVRCHSTNNSLKGQPQRFFPGKSNAISIREWANLANKSKYATTIFGNIVGELAHAITLQRSGGTDLFSKASSARPRSLSAVFYAGIRVVVVNTFVVLCFHFVPRHLGMSIELLRDIAHEILDENRVLISPLGHGFLILPLQ